MKLSFNMVAIIVVAVIVLIFISLLIRRKRPRKIKMDKFAVRWKDLQLFCKDKSTWPQAIIAADKLLDSALKRRRFSGKRMGERMVSAQRTFSDNDAVWFAHNLCKKIIADDSYNLREVDVKNALVGFRQALKDIGALPSGEPRDS